LIFRIFHLLFKVNKQIYEIFSIILVSALFLTLLPTCGGTFPSISNCQILAAGSGWPTTAANGFASLNPFTYHWKVTRPDGLFVEFNKPAPAGAIYFLRVESLCAANDFPAGFILQNTPYTFQLTAHYPDNTNSTNFTSYTFTTAPITGIKIIQKSTGTGFIAPLCGGVFTNGQPRVGINNNSLLPTGYKIQWTITRYDSTNSVLDPSTSLTLEVTQPNIISNSFWFNQNSTITPIGVSTIALVNRRYQFQIRLVYPK
jgi:hypothetical protein